MLAYRHGLQVGRSTYDWWGYDDLVKEARAAGKDSDRNRHLRAWYLGFARGLREGWYTLRPDLEEDS